MTTAAHATTLSFSYPSTRRATRVATSVRPEIGDIDDDRSRTRLERHGDTVEIRIEASDLTALRAALNTWLTLVDVAERAIEGGQSDAERAS
ncbi:KEOPS complex subunit Pcc1 [Halovivax limisalsi]|uniref:KEOPS complex subunit Pcc1 n=1 Tax=Halovivax limisalsi TaxID=1453760 RepID=UPI001FFD9FF3|nr:KEOPS complex subunit Pcc1 [Halovivax limisalsi]